MSAATKTAGPAESVLVSSRDWPSRVPDPQSETPSSPHSVHLDLKIQKKIAQFDQTIAGFHQRRWS